MIEDFYSPEELEDMARGLFQHERAMKRLDGWFQVEEIYLRTMKESKQEAHILKTAEALRNIVTQLPIYIDDNNIFAGSPRDAFARSYALINPNFKVSTFEGYCVPTEVFHDIEPNDEFTAERIESVREQMEETLYVKELAGVYDEARVDTEEVAYFIEQVNAHMIPDFRIAIREGVEYLQREIEGKLASETDIGKKLQYEAMKSALQSVVVLAQRYSDCAQKDMERSTGRRREQLALMRDTLRRIPRYGAKNLYEAIQAYILLWQVMCLEQTPNPSAFSVGNADRIFEPYREAEGLSREYAAGLFQHFLVMFNVGDRSWAISQNVLIGGKDTSGKDLTNVSSYALLDAYFTMNLPQPILSVKLHKNTPDEFYQDIGRFLFTPGCLTPSFFNDDAIFPLLCKRGADVADISDYSVAGCQEPLIMGKDNGNTTNSWLNLAKILELALNDGKSMLTGNQIGPTYTALGIDPDIRTVLSDIRSIFYRYVDYFLERMVHNANGAAKALSLLPVPFLSCFMGGIESGVDTRDVNRQGTKYNGSGCLIHGVSVVADSFIAIDRLLAERGQDAGRLPEALRTDFAHDEELRQYLLTCEKFGNNEKIVDDETVDIANRIADKVSTQMNYLGNPFRPDFATPSTHLIYGYHVGALPSGRKAREMLNYGVDPLYGEAHQGLGFRVLSTRKLPFEKFVGGYASHLGLDPNSFCGKTLEERGLEFKRKVITPLFFQDNENPIGPFYLYVNITTPETLRKVLEEPKKYAPSGVYIVRIHGTFVNFLDLSPEIQSDIIRRLDLQSTAC
ncbi:pyruvate formate lyase family protein [Diplocloster agilis]|uniref:pyruvate formate lyase family protein n=1 Tax=Diplocloster agilis TaxID=2850323 RepID=UPI000823326E|nr:pyruvate formate lyase family protein [Suonthocola fibrivorans]MCU6735860.1 hypothetical protein [Suonthocola fibrivorans]SCJ83284.1 Formate acetyltransferase 1 [uncultured Clostridium sp.]